MLKFFVLAAITAALCPCLFADSTIAFGPDTVTIKGFPPGSSVAVVSVAREQRGWLRHFTKWQDVLVDDDRDGSFVIAMGRPVPVHSVWFAIDLDTGAFARATPGVTGIVDTDVPEALLGPNAVGRAKKFAWRKPDVTIVVARPRQGIWVEQVFEGGAGDGDGRQDGLIDVTFEAMRELRRERAKGPSHLLPGDVVIGIDRLTLATFAVRIGK